MGALVQEVVEEVGRFYKVRWRNGTVAEDHIRAGIMLEWFQSRERVPMMRHFSECLSIDLSFYKSLTFIFTEWVRRPNACNLPTIMRGFDLFAGKPAADLIKFSPMRIMKQEGGRYEVEYFCGLVPKHIVPRAVVERFIYRYS